MEGSVHAVTGRPARAGHTGPSAAQRNETACWVDLAPAAEVG